MPIRYCLASALVLAPLTASAAETLHITGVGSERDIACEDGQEISITGAGHKLTLTGGCGAVEIRGRGHTVSFETAQSLYVSGIGSSATGRSVTKLTVDATRNRVVTAVKASEGPAEIEVAGADQQLDLRLGSAATVSVHGTRNRVQWEPAAGVKPPAVSISGIENKVARR